MIFVLLIFFFLLSYIIECFGGILDFVIGISWILLLLGDFCLIMCLLFVVIIVLIVILIIFWCVVRCVFVLDVFIVLSRRVVFVLILLEC